MTVLSAREPGRIRTSANEGLVGRRRRANPLDALSIRQRQVLSLVAEGRSNKSISRHLGVTERAIEAHGSQMFLKLRLDENPTPIAVC